MSSLPSVGVGPISIDPISAASFFPGAATGVGALFGGFKLLAEYGGSELSGLLSAWFEQSGGDAADLYSEISGGYISKQGGEGYGKILGLTPGTFTGSVLNSPVGEDYSYTPGVTGDINQFNINENTTIDVEGADGAISQINYSELNANIWDPLSAQTGIGRPTGDYFAQFLNPFAADDRLLNLQGQNHENLNKQGDLFIRTGEAPADTTTADTTTDIAGNDVVAGTTAVADPASNAQQAVGSSFLPASIRSLDDAADDTSFLSNLSDGQRDEVHQLYRDATGFNEDFGGGRFQDYLSGATDQQRTDADRVTEYAQILYGDATGGIPDQIQAVDDTDEDNAFRNSLSDIEREEYHSILAAATGFGEEFGEGRFNRYIENNPQVAEAGDRATEYAQILFQARRDNPAAPSITDAASQAASTNEIVASQRQFGFNSTILSDEDDDSLADLNGDIRRQGALGGTREYLGAA